MAVDSIDELKQGLQTAWDAFSISQRIGDQLREMRSLISVTNHLFILKDPAWHELAERALQMTRQMGDLKAEVNILLRIGSAYGMDDLPRSREYLQAALSKSESLNDKATELRLLDAIGEQYERNGDYFRQLTEYKNKKLRISREIGNRMSEGFSLMNCGQIQALYLGDYEGGLELEKQALRILENVTTRLFPILRIAQIESALGHYAEALAMLDTGWPLGEKIIADIGRAGLKLVAAIIYNSMGDKENLWSSLNLTSEIQQMVANNMVSRQYQMTAASQASVAHLKLAQILGGQESDEGRSHIWRALEASQTSLDIYNQFGFVQVVECTSEEIFFRHSQALSANGRAESATFLKMAYDEMMRKHAFIPSNTIYKKTFLKHIRLHRDIRSTYSLKTNS
jgi:tetratricopeptide (TPR) repeat protein